MNEHERIRPHMRPHMRARIRTSRARARLYQALADALDTPVPAWLSEPGGDNPLMDALAAATRELGSPTCDCLVEHLVSLPAQDLSMLRARHARLLVGPGRAQILPYESWHRDGQMLGEASQEVAQWYEALGAESGAGELPDHLCMELAFLAYLHREEARALEVGNAEEAQAWHKQARRFLRRHPAQWLPNVGDALAASGDPVFGPLGSLLADFIREETGPRHRPAAAGLKRAKGFPAIGQPNLCTLCGFCVQVCVPRALYIQETATDTNLMLNPRRCTGCAACTRPCPDDLLQMTRTADTTDLDEETTLFTSSRVLCPACGRPHVSAAELQAVITRLEATGPLRQSLALCVDCKAVWSLGRGV